jgi:riboflavin biosynthesis pyrimidine reductase
VTEAIVRLYPLPSQELALSGLYLSHDLRTPQGAAADRSFVYTNYVASLDGRIAVPHPTAPGLTVPQQVANDRDWRLFQELAVQADVILTSGRYLRDYAAGRAQEILRVYDDPRFADLKNWRLARGLSPQPDLAVISASLDFPIPAPLTQAGRSALVLTTAEADRQRVHALEAQLGRVLVVGEQRVAGRPLVDRLGELGYRLVYNATGPQVMHLLLADGVLDRLYLTLAHRLLGGEPFASIVAGPLLTPAIGMRLNTVYLDPHGLDGLGQLFLSYDRDERG